MNRQRNFQHRVVITGRGAISTVGENIGDFLDSLRSGRSGITRWRHIDERGYSKIGGDLSDFDLHAHLSRIGTGYPDSLVKNVRKALRNTPFSGCLTSAAALQAYIDAGLANSGIAPERIGHILAGHNLNTQYMHENSLIYEKEPELIDPHYGVMFLDTDILAVIAQALNLRGPCLSVGGACASGNLALLTAIDLLRAGRADAFVVSGGVCRISLVVRQGWAIMDALSIRSFNDTPEQASRPFDARREGFVPGEGSGVVVLETLQSAQARGAHIYAELLGVSAVSHASRWARPDVDAQAHVMHEALSDAHIRPGQIDYINAHATSTPQGDVAEVQAIKKVFGPHAYRIPINSTKSLIGHCLSAAAIIELIATLLQMEHQFVHPTINQTDPDPELDLDFVPNVARSHPIEIALSNAFGFGGLNACVIVSNGLL